MENYILQQDIHVIYIEAGSFPAGIKAAFDKLMAITGTAEKRQLFGISFPEKNGQIIYRAAAAEKFSGEAAVLGCQSFTIEKGTYSSVLIKDFMNNIPAIAKAFTELLTHPLLSSSGYCLEIYEGENDVRCMVPLTINNTL